MRFRGPPAQHLAEEHQGVVVAPLDVARIQLDRAIQLFLSGEDYVSATTLAGAAEVILGELLTRAGRKHSLDEIVDGSIAITKQLDPADTSKRKDYISLVNFYRDRLKHLSSGEVLLFSVDYEAACMIQRASDNYFTLTDSESEWMARFREFRYF
jgi:hypothetical protein